MTQKKEYRNAIRSRRIIREAFEALLHEKPLEKITATDIINQSGLNRSTFYAHYPDVKGIIDEITGEVFTMFAQLLAEMDFSRFLENPEPNLRRVVSFLEENQNLYRLLGQSHMSLTYLEQLKNMLIRQVLETPNLPTGEHSQVSLDIRKERDPHPDLAQRRHRRLPGMAVRQDHLHPGRNDCRGGKNRRCVIQLLS